MFKNNLMKTLTVTLLLYLTQHGGDDVSNYANELKHYCSKAYLDL